MTFHHPNSLAVWQLQDEFKDILADSELKAWLGAMELDIRDVTEAWELLQDRPKTAETSSTGKKSVTTTAWQWEDGVDSRETLAGWVGGEAWEVWTFILLRCFPMEVGDERVRKQVFPRFNLYLQFPRGLSSPTASWNKSLPVAQETFCLNPAVGGCGPDLRWKNLRLICILPRYITDDLVRKRIFFIQWLS